MSRRLMVSLLLKDKNRCSWYLYLSVLFVSLLLYSQEADGYSAEKVVEDLTGQRLFEGIPFYDSAPVSPRPKGSLTQYLGLSKRKPKGVSAGHILFSLRSLPLDKMYCFSFADGRPAMCSITRLSNREYKINGSPLLLYFCVPSPPSPKFWLTALRRL